MLNLQHHKIIIAISFNCNEKKMKKWKWKKWKNEHQSTHKTESDQTEGQQTKKILSSYLDHKTPQLSLKYIIMIFNMANNIGHNYCILISFFQHRWT